jgi:hypothetical protein
VIVSSNGTLYDDNGRGVTAGASPWLLGADNVSVVSVATTGVRTGCYSGFEMAFVGVMAAVMSAALIVTAVICCKEMRRARKAMTRKLSCCEDLPLQR